MMGGYGPWPEWEWFIAPDAGDDRMKIPSNWEGTDQEYSEYSRGQEAEKRRLRALQAKRYSEYRQRKRRGER